MKKKDVFDEYADSYSEQVDKSLGQFGASQDFFTRHKAWLIEDLLARSGRQPDTMSLLDVGCGIGNIHGLFRGKFRKVAGVDVSAESLRVAAQEFGEFDYQLYDGQHLPFEDGSFDMVMAICVFHHVPPDQWPQVAREMIRVARDGGLILVVEHNPYNPVTRYIVNSCPIDEDAVLLSPSRLRSLFDFPSAGQVSTRSILNVPPVTRLMKKLDRMLGRLPIGAQYYLTATKCN
jgi:ubiquinone/menaquinone biosynthesis C-methylase UbiE